MDHKYFSFKACKNYLNHYIGSYRSHDLKKKFRETNTSFLSFQIEFDKAVYIYLIEHTFWFNQKVSLLIVDLLDENPAVSKYCIIYILRMPESCIDYRRQGDTCHFLSLKKRYTYYKSYKKITESSVIVITAMVIIF